jgi:hypothetical protein
MNFITYPYDMGLMFSMIMSKVHVGTFTMGKSPNDFTPKCQGKPIWSTFQCIFVTFKGLNKVKLDTKTLAKDHRKLSRTRSKLKMGNRLVN